MTLLLLMLACGRPPEPGPVDLPGSPVATVVPTQDGAAVHLLRYPAQGPPVILVHGVSSNHRTWDLDADRSLARRLQTDGYDAWLLDLRGHGLATHDAGDRRQRSGWSIEDYARYDLPAAIDHVRQDTGYDRVAYVGHSMGGMVAAIYNALEGDDALAALVVVGSPVDFGHPETLLQLAQATSPVASTLSGTLATPTMARMAAWLPRSPLFVDPLLMAEDNVAPEVRKALFREIVSPMSRGELTSLHHYMAQGFTSDDGSVDYVSALAQLDTPLLVIAGRGDRIAPVDRVAPYYDNAGSADKQLVVASRANGFSHDYGHLDLAMGDSAAAEIHPLIVGWLEGRWP